LLAEQFRSGAKQDVFARLGESFEVKVVAIQGELFRSGSDPFGIYGGLV